MREAARALIVQAADTIHYAAGQLEDREPRIGRELRKIADRLHELANRLR